ncbi:hypothetical protein QT199_015550 [Xanthomonas phaseoli pv. phaseoli]|uniref:Xsa-associated protein n=2 Tax=Xanthomonas campestris pv. phaseoli TaxID=317013 RepID=A0AB38DU67_XANCH|nr:hypothetical protein [Xanthomonas phaseoli]ATS26032.2 hypothetical protein XppCFBP6164P_11205 [Xanthomonas phaseoli pv. phaseoli]ATS30474.2 hypothetical protein XppCFBP6546P_12485 [Xanthomonas phaseoli pv. phaseoli]MBO9737118.1 hypothetical protein [Xanthomonas phaseoli pv. phaseoli]MBO9744682.1 hypothetical protein [Xanthomonas phaseoli pv. phaseoli]MDM4801520.1 hypothetical protein [Xanthomonas phaseoli pv. phaseoli]
MMYVDLTEMPLSVLLLLCGLMVLSLYFALCFVLPSLLLLVRIRRANGRVRQMAALGGGPVADAEFDAIFDADRHLARSWQNYRKTLASAGGAAGNRATIPAAVCFDRQENVEVPLKLEFFRHCPGLMTGIGIVGTFSGLLLGLHHFADAIVPKAAALVTPLQQTGAIGHVAVSGASAAVPDGAFVSFISGAAAPLPMVTGLKTLDQGEGGMAGATIVHAPAAVKMVMDPNVLTGALGRLLHSVSDAFVVSAIAVLCALLTTFIEKLLMAQCFHQLQELSSTIDGVFAFNPGEDPMTHLTRTSEATERQIKRIALALNDITISRDRV